MNNKINCIKLFLLACMALISFACNDLDVPPMNIIGDENIFSTEKGIDAYFSRLYADMPVVQFAGGSLGGENGYSFDGEGVTLEPGNVAANSFDQWSGGGGADRGRVWAYAPIRTQNYFLEKLPEYAGKFDALKVNTWTAEVYFIRAFRYFEMVKRYGGVPIVDKVLNYPVESLEEVTKPRDKEKDCYDFILRDLDKAIELFEKGVRDYKVLGRANIWVAQALKARVALYAGSIAKYGSQYPERYANYENGLIGIPAGEAKNYFDIAWKAAKAVIDGGPYELFKGKWGESYNDKVENYAYTFLDKNVANKENLFAVYHMSTSPSNGTMFASNYLPPQYSGGSSGFWFAPTLDVVKLYEDTDGNSYSGINTGTDDNPVYYDSPGDLFAKAEPRLKASILLPGEAEFRKEMTSPDNVKLDIRYGVLPEGNLPSASTIANDVITSTRLTEFYKVGNDSIRITGKCGNGTFGSYSGFYFRKWLDPTLTIDQMTFGTGSQVAWIEFRYAEVLLSAAEAAVELGELGDASHNGDAAAYINAIRERAGAFNRNYTASTLTKEVVRNERRKELFFENKTYWDM
ncbi:MAG: RagB/SusD family nutrient uptake outer membrane protein, partial [Dysgonamonadaceae bacterium]|nr:RagB/SusD family nutrient uptake outer membrane protein [Dysgonamonadaceae bacterium]